jgi:thymidine phosphorylase
MACGASVPQASGLRLGHTGGTLDKLEAIAGFTAELSKDRIRQQLQDIGAAIFAAGDLAPADRKLYALRDVCNGGFAAVDRQLDHGKKLSEGRRLVLDTKVGRGAFLKTEAEARAGQDHGRAGHRTRRRHPRASHRHGRAAGTHRRQRG